MYIYYVSVTEPNQAVNRSCTEAKVSENLRNGTHLEMKNILERGWREWGWDE